MGTNSSKNAPSTFSNYAFQNVREDPGYGEVQIYTNKTKPTEQLALVKLGIHENQDIQKKFQQIKQKCDNQHPNLTKVFDCQQSQADDLCSSINLLHVGIEYLEKNMAQDIAIRRQMKTTYSEGEIWYIVQTVISTLKDVNPPYLDLHPQNLRITPQGEIKLLDLTCLPTASTNLQKVQVGFRDVEYLSPEQLQILHKTTPQEYNQEKNNIFVLGVICLVCLTNLPVAQFYNSDECTFNHELVSQKLNSAFQKYNYSDSLRHLLTDLLNKNAIQRPNCYEINEKLNKIDQSKISIHLYSNASQQPMRQSTLQLNQLHNNTNSNFLIENIIESTPQIDQSKLIPSRIDQMPLKESEYSQDGQDGFDKLRQLKQRFQHMKGETSTPQKSVTHISQDEPQSKYIFQSSQHQPNFQEIDPIIQKVLQKSREVMQRCSPYPQNNQEFTLNDYVMPVTTLSENTQKFNDKTQQKLFNQQNSQQYLTDGKLYQQQLIQSQQQQQQQISQSSYTQIPNQQQQSYYQPSQQQQAMSSRQSNQQDFQYKQPQQQQYYNQQNIQQLLQQAEIEIQKSNQISQKYFQQQSAI